MRGNHRLSLRLWTRRHQFNHQGIPLHGTRPNLTIGPASLTQNTRILRRDLVDLTAHGSHHLRLRMGGQRPLLILLEGH